MFKDPTEQLKTHIIKTKYFNWMHDGKNKQCDIIFFENGKVEHTNMKYKQSKQRKFINRGFWQCTEAKKMIAKFGQVGEHTLEFSEDLSEAVLINPMRNPQTKMIANPEDLTNGIYTQKM